MGGKNSGAKPKTHEQFVKEIEELVGNEFTVVSQYVNSETKIRIRHNCSKCNNYEWDVLPGNFKKRRKCKKCSGYNKKRTQEEFEQDVFNDVGDEYTVLGKYVNDNTGVLMRHNCELCNNYEWETKPHYFLNSPNREGRRCPECNRLKTISNMCSNVEQYFEDKELEYDTEIMLEGCIYTNKLSIDYLYKNIFIEIDGRQHFFGYNDSIVEKELQQLRDTAKNNYCLNNYLTLIRIPYIEEKNLINILDAIILGDFNALSQYNCLIISNGNIMTKPEIYSWYISSDIIVNGNEN